MPADRGDYGAPMIRCGNTCHAPGVWRIRATPGGGGDDWQKRSKKCLTSGRMMVMFPVNTFYQSAGREVVDSVLAATASGMNLGVSFGSARRIGTFSAYLVVKGESACFPPGT